MDRNKISTAWVSNLTKEEKESFLTYLMNNYDNHALCRLKEIVVAKRINLEASERNPSNYDNANWAYLQAHNNGANQALKFVEDLLAFTK